MSAFNSTWVNSERENYWLILGEEGRGNMLVLNIVHLEFYWLKTEEKSYGYMDYQ